MNRTACLLIAFGATLAACSESNGGSPPSTGGQSSATSGGFGGQGMGGSSAGDSSTSGGATASGGAPMNGGSANGGATNGGSAAMNGGSANGGATNGGGKSSGGSANGGSANGGASSGSSSSGGSSTGGKSGGGSANAGAGTGGSGGSQAGATGSGGSAGASCAPTVTSANRTLVAQAIDDLFVKKDVTAIDRYWSEPYLQHNPIAKSGVTTFRSLMGSLVSSASFQYERLLTLADCELAVVYGRYSQTGVIFDMFRVQGGKIMEHWDSDTNQASEASGVDALDTAAPTAENRALFAQFAATVLVGGDSARAADYLSSNFVEHRGAAGGRSAFTQYLSRESISYTKVHHLIVDGNYVFALSEGKRGSAGYGFYDLFRAEGGKLVEHWDSRRSVPSSTMSGLPIF